MRQPEGPARIDSHQHFWRIERGDYGWMSPDLTIARDFMPEDLLPHLQAHDIARTILVQAAPTEAETRFLLGVARETDFVAGVVGWVDMEARDAPDRLAALAQDPWLVGIRPMIQDLPDDAWMLKPELDAAFRALIELDLRFDALLFPRHLPFLLRLIDRWPSLRIVVDHGAKPGIRAGAFQPWADGIKAVGAFDHVVCKLSGLVTEAGPGWTPDDLAPYCDRLFEVFGPDRLMFGSDWPVLTLASDYARWIGLVEDRLLGLRPAEKGAVLGGTAARFYQL